MALTFGTRFKPVVTIYPQACTSDGVNGTGVTINGYNRAFFICHSGLVATGDSDDTMTFTVYKNEVTSVASDAAATDWVAITAAAVAQTAPATTDATLGDGFIDVDFQTHSLSTGLLRVSALASEGASVSISATAILYRPNGVKYDSDLSIAVVYPASS